MGTKFSCIISSLIRSEKIVDSIHEPHLVSGLEAALSSYYTHIYIRYLGISENGLGHSCFLVTMGLYDMLKIRQNTVSEWLETLRDL